MDIEDSIENDSDYSNREYKATIQNIENIGGKFVKSIARRAEDLATNEWAYAASCEPEKDWAYTVFSWLWEHDQVELESQDDQGGYPSEDAIKAALKALDILDSEYDVCHSCEEHRSCPKHDSENEENESGVKDG